MEEGTAGEEGMEVGIHMGMDMEEGMEEDMEEGMGMDMEDIVGIVDMDMGEVGVR